MSDLSLQEIITGRGAPRRFRSLDAIVLALLMLAFAGRVDRRSEGS